MVVQCVGIAVGVLLYIKKFLLSVNSTSTDIKVKSTTKINPCQKVDAISLYLATQTSFCPS